MFTVSTVQDCIFGRVGIRNSTNPEATQLNASVIASTSGLYVNDYHPLLTVENIENCAPQFSEYVFDAWSATTTYALAARVKTGNIVYQSKQATNLNHAVTDTDWWSVVSLLSEYLENLMKSSASRLISEMSVSKKLNRETKSLIENLRLFRGAGRLSNIATNNSKFVGLEISLKRHNSIRAKLHKIGLQLSVAQDLTLYLYQSGQEDAIETKVVTVASANKFQWTTLDWDLYFAGDLDPSGVYYLGYYQDDLTGSAIIKDVDWVTGAGCSSCDNYDANAFRKYNKYIDFEAIQADPNGVKLWDISNTAVVFNTNHGLNLELSVYCDISRIVCQQVHIIDDVFAKMVAVDLLKMMVHSFRNNDHAKKAMTEKQAMMIYHEVDGNDHSIGIVRDYKRALKALEFDFSSIDKVCMPCQKRTIRYIAR